MKTKIHMTAAILGFAYIHTTTVEAGKNKICLLANYSCYF